MGPERSYEELCSDECTALLAEGRVGRVAGIVDNQPFIFPVNYTLEDVARRLHVAAPFPVAVSADLMTLRQDLLQKKVVKGTKGVLDKVLAKERNWIGQHEK